MNKETELRHEAWRQYKADGHTHKEVAEHFGISIWTSKVICGSPSYKVIDRKTEESRKEYVDSFLPDQFSYIDGYKNRDSTVRIKCSVCGGIFEKKLESIRQGRFAYGCPLCLKAKKEEKKNKKNNPKANIQSIISMRKAGVGFQEIADTLGLSYSRVAQVSRQNNLGIAVDKNKQYNEWKKYKAQGHTNKEVAEHFGVSVETAKRICVGISPQIRGHTNQNSKTTEEEKKNYVESFLSDDFSYSDGYIDCDHRVNLKCKICGTIFDASMISLRKGNKIKCPACKAEEKRKEKEKIEKEVADQKEQARKKAAQKKAEREAEREAKKRIIKCKVCGKEFITYSSRRVTCSAECSKKRNNQISSHRKDKRLTKDKRIDRGITAKALYKKDKGVCWICGGKCDLNDYIIKDGAFVCGDSYPSVDHVIPVCEGGEDSWQNVRLAHRYCNSRRYWEKSRSPRVAV